MKMNEKQKLQLMTIINDYEISKEGNKHTLMIDDTKYLFKTKKDAIKFGYFLTMLDNEGETSEPSDILTQKITVEDCENEINFFIHDNLLDMFAMIGTWHKDTKNGKYSWLYTSGSCCTSEFLDFESLEEFISLIEEDYNIKIDLNSINDNVPEYFTNACIDWVELAQELIVIKEGYDSLNYDKDIETMFNILEVKRVEEEAV